MTRELGSQPALVVIPGRQDLRATLLKAFGPQVSYCNSLFHREIQRRIDL
jgi:hypothetical protein